MNFDELKNPELQEKLKACKSVDELVQLAREEGAELTDEQLDAVAGGYLYHNDEGNWEVIGIKGDVRFTGDYESAWNWADKHRYSTYEITWKQLNKLRHGDKDIWV